MLISALRPMGHGLLWMYNRSLLRPSRFDLYHEPNYIPIPCDIPTVVTIHDLSIVRHPEWHPPERVDFFERNLPRGLRQAQHFFTDTEHARREMIELLNIPTERITCSYCGTRGDLAPMTEAEYRPVLRRLGLPKQYLLHVGTIEPRKNLLRLMRAYVDLPGSLREKFPLVLVGQWGWRFDETADFFHSTAKHKGVIQTGFLPDADLPAVYNGARALVFPTLYEGFGIPAVEMMGCGGAVLASTAGAVAEVVGSHGTLIHPEDVEGWRDAIQRVLTDDEYWKGLRRSAMTQAGRFTWERTAEATVRVYREIVGEETAASQMSAKAA
jgi:alpha-1,3-rhamnosyl/mannosyltransferase